MTHRTTFALDEKTAQRLKRLARKWNVSQAEVVRRSVERAEQDAPGAPPDRVGLLKAYHAKGGLDRARATKWTNEIAEDRNRWRAS